MSNFKKIFAAAAVVMLAFSSPALAQGSDKAVVEAAKAAVDAAEQAKTVASSAGDLLGAFSNGHVLTVALLAVALACIAFVGIRYVLKMRAGDVVAK